MTLQPGAGVNEHILSPIFHIHTQRHTYMRAHNPCPHILFMHFRGADAGISYTGGSSHSFHYTHTYLEGLMQEFRTPAAAHILFTTRTYMCGRVHVVIYCSLGANLRFVSTCQTGMKVNLLHCSYPLLTFKDLIILMPLFHIV